MFPPLLPPSPAQRTPLPRSSGSNSLNVLSFKPMSCLIGDRERVALDWMYNGSKDETFRELELKLDRGDGVDGAGDGESYGGNVVMWVSPFPGLCRITSF
ncbi:hypothetical protein Bca52824_054604 [Brassica carinata]|uniref:Uncharacterized protein n=1 Tax=Brassica carinata TaxID=52824 RepID=A0A8X7R6E7_BRACI|nr:hypothetical protein Bca52824_054604 [Brassica carinata]